MCGRFLLIALVLVVCVGIVPAEAGVLSSPHGGCDQALVQLARSSQMYLDAARCKFSPDSIANALVVAGSRRMAHREALA